MEYITFMEYKQLSGSVTNEATFNRLYNRCKVDVDNTTFNRIKGVFDSLDEDQLNRLHLCMVEIIDLRAIDFNSSQQAIKHGGKVSSVSNDGVSISIDTSLTNNANSSSPLKHQIIRTIQEYLPEFSYRGLH